MNAAKAYVEELAKYFTVELSHKHNHYGYVLVKDGQKYGWITFTEHEALENFGHRSAKGVMPYINGSGRLLTALCEHIRTSMGTNPVPGRCDGFYEGYKDFLVKVRGYFQ